MLKKFVPIWKHSQKGQNMFIFGRKVFKLMKHWTLINALTDFRLPFISFKNTFALEIERKHVSITKCFNITTSMLLNLQLNNNICMYCVII